MRGVLNRLPFTVEDAIVAAVVLALAGFAIVGCAPVKPPPDLTRAAIDTASESNERSASHIDAGLKATADVQAGLSKLRKLGPVTK